MQKTLILFLACLLCLGKVQAQKEANIWTFGGGMTLNFGQDVAQIKDDVAIQTFVANSSICDKNGDLLFYTDGITAWNGKHQKIKKADSLAHAGSVLIVPKPEQEGVYFVFGVQVMPRYTSILREEVLTKEAKEKGYWGKKDTIYVKEAVLSYSVIDMRKNNGQGELIQKNIILMDSCLTDICAIKHENQKDFWLIAHQNYSNKFLAYKIDKQGIAKISVVTEMGNRIERSHQNYMSLSSNNFLKGALNEKKIAMFGGVFTREVQIFDFDKTTGKLSNPRLFKMPNQTQMWTMEFSPNSSKLLVGGMKQSPMYKIEEARPYICQIDLEAKHPYEITRYADKVFMEFVPKDIKKYFWPQFLSMQLAPDGKIYTYMTSYGYERNLITLDNPNAPAKDYKITFLKVAPNEIGGVFPNCMHLLPNETELSTAFAVGKVFKRNILFDTNQYTLKPEHEQDLHDILAYLTKNSKSIIEIMGHTDNEGEESKNQKLSEVRAQALANFLIKNNIGKERIKAVGYGSSKPIAENTSPEGKAKNRRIEFLVK